VQATIAARVNQCAWAAAANGGAASGSLASGAPHLDGRLDGVRLQASWAVLGRTMGASSRAKGGLVVGPGGPLLPARKTTRLLAAASGEGRPLCGPNDNDRVLSAAT